MCAPLSQMHWPRSAGRGSHAPHCCLTWLTYWTLSGTLNYGCWMHLLLWMEEKKKRAREKLWDNVTGCTSRHNLKELDLQALPPHEFLFCRCFSEALLPPGKLLEHDFLFCLRQWWKKCNNSKIETRISFSPPYPASQSTHPPPANPPSLYLLVT